MRAFRIPREIYVKQCLWCGIDVPLVMGKGRPRKYCSPKCAGKWHRAADAERRPWRPDEHRTCANPECGNTWLAGKRGPTAKYCDIKCRRAAEKLSKPRTCQNPLCSVEFVKHRGRSACSETCAKVIASYLCDGIGAAHSCAIRLGALVATRVFFVTCMECEAPICSRAKKGVQYCGPCKARAVADARLVQRHRRRALGKCMTVRQLVKRDGDRCHICGKRVDLASPGGYRYPMSASVDHLIPVSKGGTNDPTNVALAHYQCNIRRGNTGAAQLRLIG